MTTAHDRVTIFSRYDTFGLAFGPPLVTDVFCRVQSIAEFRLRCFESRCVVSASRYAFFSTLSNKSTF